MDKSAETRVAIVTGAASGIGLGTSLRLLKDGFRVLAVDIQGDALESCLLEYPEKLALTIADITGEEAPEAIRSVALAAFSRIDALINNAGIGAAKSAERTSDADWDRYLDVNLRAAFRLSRSVLPDLKLTAGTIVNVASTFGIIGNPGTAPYAASKAGLIGLTRQMAADYGPAGIRVNAVAPGLIETPLTRSRLESPSFRRLLVETTPFPRLGTPNDIAAAISFLCSTDASFVNGHVLVVDGGWSAVNYVATACQSDHAGQ